MAYCRHGILLEFRKCSVFFLLSFFPLSRKEKTRTRERRSFLIIFSFLDCHFRAFLFGLSFLVSSICDISVLVWYQLPLNIWSRLLGGTWIYWSSSCNLNLCSLACLFICASHVTVFFTLISGESLPLSSFSSSLFLFLYTYLCVQSLCG